MCDLNPEKDGRNLPLIFDEIWKFYNNLENGCDKTTDEHKNEMERIIQDTEKAVHMVNALGIFSTNEDIAEVTTIEIRYILLPALLGYFTENRRYDQRLNLIDKSQIYYKDFLRLCNDYGVTDIKPPTEKKQSTGRPDLVTMNKESAERIALYRAEVQRNKKLSSFEEAGLDKLDDEELRDYNITMLEKFIAIALYSLKSFLMEIPILQHQQKLKEDKVYASETLLQNMNIKKKEKKQPFIITKNTLQKQVFGLGYPSTPVMTVDEYYEEMVANGEFPPPPAPSSAPTRTIDSGSVRRIEGGDASAPAADSEETKARKDAEIDNDDEEALMKARNWDEFKDDNRRGWGNMQNKG